MNPRSFRCSLPCADRAGDYERRESKQARYRNPGASETDLMLVASEVVGEPVASGNNQRGYVAPTGLDFWSNDLVDVLFSISSNRVSVVVTVIHPSHQSLRACSHRVWSGRTRQISQDTVFTKDHPRRDDYSLFPHLLFKHDGKLQEFHRLCKACGTFGNRAELRYPGRHSKSDGSAVFRTTYAARGFMRTVLHTCRPSAWKRTLTSYGEHGQVCQPIRSGLGSMLTRLGKMGADENNGGCAAMFAVRTSWPSVIWRICLMLEPART